MGDLLNNVKEIDVNYIIDIVQRILDKSHSNPKDRIIRPKLSGDRKELNFNCPICLDGHSKKHRGHLYLNNFYYVCYNERETDSMSFTNLCKYFNVEIDPEKRMQIYNHIDQNFKYNKKEDFSVGNLDKLVDTKEFFDHLNEKKGFLYNIYPIQKDSIQYKYLTDRKIFNHENIYQGIYKITDTWKENVILILNQVNDKLLGFQIRNLKEQKEKRIYKFYQFENIYNIMHPDDKLDDIDAISYNKISAVFNILNVDFENTVYVFEGYLDSVFFPNSIALVGLDTDISFLEGEKLDLKFVFDNDVSGMKKARQMLDDDLSVFLWKKLFRDIAKGRTKVEYYMNNNIKDINKLAEYLDKINVYDELKLNKYFAIDKLDLIDL